MTTQIQEYSNTDGALATLAQAYKGIRYDVTTSEGMALAKAARAELRDYRVNLEKKRVQIKAPALERSRLIDAEAKRITAELVALEDPIDAQIKGEEGRKEREREAKIEAERLRVAGIQERIAEIRGAVAAAGSCSSSLISEHMDDVGRMVIGPEFAEFAEAATAAKEQTLYQLAALHEAARQREEEAIRLKAERAELEALRADQAKRQAEEAERERAAAAARAEADRVAQVQRDRLAAESRAAAEAEAARIREAAEADQRRKREALDAEESRQRAERARMCLEQAKAESAALDRRIAEATLVDAAADAEAFLANNGFAAHPVTLVLCAALDRELRRETPAAAAAAA